MTSIKNNFDSVSVGEDFDWVLKCGSVLRFHFCDGTDLCKNVVNLYFWEEVF